MTLELYNAPKESCGITTSGGTESIIMAMLAYREWGLKTKGITKPNIVMSHTAHAAFDKACHYFHIECRKVPQKNMRFDMKAYEKQIDKNTICLIASAPEFPFGNMDPIAEVAKLA